MWKRKKTTRLRQWEKARLKRDPNWYGMYLRSRHWKSRRRSLLVECKWTCQDCGAIDPNRDKVRGTRLQAHHLTYERIGRERKSDLVILCAACHKKRHGR